METFFAPASLAVYGLSTRARNAPRIIVGNCRRWGYRGRIFGVNPATTETEVDGIRVYRSAAHLPLVPDVAALLIPARFIPEAMADCGQAGIKRLAIQAGGFNEVSDAGRGLAARLLALARQHTMRFIGPNCLALADTASGLCLPFVPSFPVRPGGFSLITQSGGLGLFLWNLLDAEQVGLAKFASIGNKLDLDECDLLEYLGADPATKVIGIYLESIGKGRRLVELAERIDKPVLLYKANTTQAGGRAAVSHTAALSTDDALLDAALERAGILRVDRLRDFVTTAKAFELPPMRGNRVMLMSPAGGLGVAMADLCEHQGFTCADPGPAFFEELAEVARADIIRLQNPLDMGDIDRVDQYPQIFSRVLDSDQVDGAIFASQRPLMPTGGADMFTAMFTVDPTPAAAEAVRLVDKPLVLVMYGEAQIMATMKAQSKVPVFDGLKEAIGALHRQMRYHGRKAAGPFRPDPQDEGFASEQIEFWLRGRGGVVGEEALELLACCGLASPASALARTAEEAADMAARLGSPVVLKVVSPGAVHKTEVGGVLMDIGSAAEAARGFDRIRANLERHCPGARFDGVRVAAMAPAGHDLFIGGLQDPAFGPVVLFGHGGIFVEVFKDVERILAPSSLAEITSKIERLRSAPLFAGSRGRPPVDPSPFARAILAVARLLAEFPQIAELDVNPVRLLDQGGALALDARLRLDNL